MKIHGFKIIGIIGNLSHGVRYIVKTLEGHLEGTEILSFDVTSSVGLKIKQIKWLSECLWLNL